MEKTDLKILRHKMQHALDTVATECGVAIKIGNIRYQENNARTTLSISTLDKATGYPKTAEADAFLAHAMLLGFAKDDLFRQFDCDGETYVLMGFKPRAPKKPFMVRKLDNGQNFVVNETWLKRALGYPLATSAAYAR